MPSASMVDSVAAIFPTIPDPPGDRACAWTVCPFGTVALPYSPANVVRRPLAPEVLKRFERLVRYRSVS